MTVVERKLSVGLSVSPTPPRPALSPVLVIVDDTDPVTDEEDLGPGGTDARRPSTENGPRYDGSSSDTDTYSVEASEAEWDQQGQMQTDDVSAGQYASSSGVSSVASANNAAPTSNGFLSAGFGSRSRSGSNVSMVEEFDFGPASPAPSPSGEAARPWPDTPVPPLLLDPVQVTTHRVMSRQVAMDSDGEDQDDDGEVAFTDDECEIDDLEPPPAKQAKKSDQFEEEGPDTDCEDVPDEDGLIVDEEDAKGRRGSGQLNRALANWSRLVNSMAVVEKWKLPASMATDQRGCDGKGQGSGLSESWKWVLGQAMSQRRASMRQLVENEQRDDVEASDTDSEDLDGEEEPVTLTPELLRKKEEAEESIIAQLDSAASCNVATRISWKALVAKAVGPAAASPGSGFRRVVEEAGAWRCTRAGERGVPDDAGVLMQLDGVGRGSWDIEEGESVVCETEARDELSDDYD
jgi:hypothetical protein